MKKARKIVNDPVYGFITIDDPMVFRVISHRYYQRLRRIQQMAFAQLVYPGAVHTRLHHSLGAYHLMGLALAELRSKGAEISMEEETAAKIAILLHDVGHGPYSHALEHTLIEGVHHEKLSLLIMEALNQELGGGLDLAIKIFRGDYHKSFLHQLISGQLDVDRMDYLTRDSFFTGVAEGVIGYDRIIKMLAVHEGQLVVEEKGIFSIEKFLVSRRLMYWQVYLHKTVLCAEKMLVTTIMRAKELIRQGVPVSAPSPVLDYFLQQQQPPDIAEKLELFCQLDDVDILGAIKSWVRHPDKVLAALCRMLVDRRLLKVRLQADPVSEEVLYQHRQEVAAFAGISESDATYLVFSGEASNTTYDPHEERIHILFKDGSVRDISGVDNALIQHNLARPVKKYYFCYLNPVTASGLFDPMPY